jgi:hypothetical protein
MSKKTPKRRGNSIPAGRAKPAAPPPPPTGSVRRGPAVLAAGIGVVILAVVLGGAALVLGGSRSSASPSAAASAASQSSLPASSAATTEPVASAAGSASAGGALAEAAIKALHANPFLGHVAVTTVARDATKATLERETATASGDISGSDVDLHVTDVGGSNPAVDQEVVVVGDVAWVRPEGGSWTAHPRTDVAPSIDGLRTTIELLADPNRLVDLGVETIDGQQLHHLSAADGVTYQSASGTGAYDSLDLWVTEAGVPVIAKGSFNATYGDIPVVGNVDIRYTDLGKAVDIRPPAGAPSLAPSPG